MISNSLDIHHIHVGIHDRSCTKSKRQSNISFPYAPLGGISDVLDIRKKVLFVLILEDLIQGHVLEEVDDEHVDTAEVRCFWCDDLEQCLK